ncbi:MAG: ComF family protein [Hyphomicrobiales bacterium]|nr:ComF family protein [Hyphomicrobiales bacterium]MCP5370700.1 ComF family protein [Hyphomicrobiales bacterium]
MERTPWQAPDPLRRAGRRVLDLLLPPQCLACGALVDEAGALCGDCWSKITFITEPCCAACGLPFNYDPGPGVLCGDCARRRPAFDRARAVLAYDEHSRGLVLAFKHGDRTDAAPAYARWLAQAGAGLLAEAELVVPVPLHWTRLFARRYNQAALLAQQVARLGGVPYAPEVLVRRRRTPSQGHLGAAARRRNLRGAFAVPPGRRPRLARRRVLLVDDVMTSGATATACALTLLRAGAAAVDVLSLARVLRAAP